MSVRLSLIKQSRRCRERLGWKRVWFGPFSVRGSEVLLGWVVFSGAHGAGSLLSPVWDSGSGWKRLLRSVATGISMGRKQLEWTPGVTLFFPKKLYL